MKHHQKHRKLGRETNQRKALMRSMARSLLLHEKIVTTEAKAKELRPFVEELVTKARTNDLATRRNLISSLGGEKDVTKKLFDVIAPQYLGRQGGYTRITKLPIRLGDAAKMAQIEFVK